MAEYAVEVAEEELGPDGKWKIKMEPIVHEEGEEVKEGAATEQRVLGYCIMSEKHMKYCGLFVRLFEDLDLESIQHDSEGRAILPTGVRHATRPITRRVFEWLVKVLGLCDDNYMSPNVDPEDLRDIPLTAPVPQEEGGSFGPKFHPDIPKTFELDNYWYKQFERDCALMLAADHFDIPYVVALCQQVIAFAISNIPEDENADYNTYVRLFGMERVPTDKEKAEFVKNNPWLEATGPMEDPLPEATGDGVPAAATPAAAAAAASSSSEEEEEESAPSSSEEDAGEDAGGDVSEDDLPDLE